MSNHVYVICGPAGAGKTTVANYLRDQYGMHQVITHTTRAPRQNEVDGVSYHFETSESIQKLHLLESVTYDGSRYGSSLEGLEEGWKQGQDDVIVLDTKGAATYCDKLGDQVTVIFITVQDKDKLIKRMVDRGDDADSIKARINSPEYERDLALPDDLRTHATDLVTITNDDWEQTRKTLDLLVANNIR
ncbi:MAG: AAA family ATPase [Limosilactobacillus sp.]|uniref:guanylate kinase n=1 Tax=Limosilactobacillus sp. TaxID=2773925 RepID=UPI0026FF9A2B|nr:AAA family ATPase [Limosilactobacillus sp.]